MGPICVFYPDSACPRCAPACDNPACLPSTSTFQSWPLMPSLTGFRTFRSRPPPASRRPRENLLATELQPAASRFRPRAGRYGRPGGADSASRPDFPAFSPSERGCTTAISVRYSCGRAARCRIEGLVLGGRFDRHLSLDRLKPRPPTHVSVDPLPSVLVSMTR